MWRPTAAPADVAASDGYAISLRCRKRIEKIFGWGKTTAGLHQLTVWGIDKVAAVFTLALTAYNIVRQRKLLAATGEVCLDAAR